MAKKILLLCESYGGGVKTHLDYIYKYQQEFVENDLDLFYLFSKNRMNNSEDDKDYYMSTTFNKDLISTLMDIAKVLKREEIDIIHAHSTKAGIFGVVTKFLFKNIKLIYTPHAYYSQNRDISWGAKLFVKTFEKIMIKAATKVIHVSVDEEKYYRDELKGDISKSCIIYNGVDITPTSKMKHKKDTKIRIINIARASAQKNPFEFIDIAKKIASLDTENRYEFYYAGDGELLEELKQKVKKCGLKNTFFLGHRDDIEELLNDSDIFLSTSKYEGLPFSVVKALAMKKTVVLSDVIGHRDLCEDNGVLYPLGDIDFVAASIVNISQDDRLMKSYSENSSKLFKEKFHVSNMITSLKNQYINL